MTDYVAKWRANDRSVRKLLQSTELWFMPVLNPDGYQYTFDTERLWRKNLRDNDGNGIINSNDGVDPNRNYAEHWNYDDEGSSSLFPSQTYRGPAPESEAETKAMVSLFDKVHFKFAISYHSFGPLLLSKEFAAKVKHPVRSIGHFDLRGVSGPQEMFTVEKEL